MSKCLKYCAAVLLIAYSCVIATTPNQFLVYRDEPSALPLGRGLTLTDLPDGLETSAAGEVLSAEEGEYRASVALFGALPVKRVRVNVVAPKSIVPCGNLVGVRLYSDGLVVVGMAEITAEDGSRRSPAQEAGLMVGDIVTEIDGEKLSNIDALHRIMRDAGTSVWLHLVRGEQELDLHVKPQHSAKDGSALLGMWVRDAAAGVGTMTYYDPETMRYGALGHPISDVDTGVRFQIQKGSIAESQVRAVQRGNVGAPGELSGMVSENAPSIGTIDQNTDCGIFGTLLRVPTQDETSYPIGLKSSVSTGKASLLCNVEGRRVQEYEIEVSKIFSHGESTRGMLITVTDPELLAITGGIVQGMSGSPILQDGKLIGAVTHVLVNDPTRGYGIFMENMYYADAEIG